MNGLMTIPSHNPWELHPGPLREELRKVQVSLRKHLAQAGTRTSSDCGAPVTVDND